jgi:hypothetical protein
MTIFRNFGAHAIRQVLWNPHVRFWDVPIPCPQTSQNEHLTCKATSFFSGAQHFNFSTFQLCRRAECENKCNTSSRYIDRTSPLPRNGCRFDHPPGGVDCRIGTFTVGAYCNTPLRRKRTGQRSAVQKAGKMPALRQPDAVRQNDGGRRYMNLLTFQLLNISTVLLFHPTTIQRSRRGREETGV